MCRALVYIGQPVLLGNFLYEPDSALVRQSTLPRKLQLLNVSGFGMRAWAPRAVTPSARFPITRSRFRSSPGISSTSPRRFAWVACSHTFAAFPTAG